MSRLSRKRRTSASALVVSFPASNRKVESPDRSRTAAWEVASEGAAAFHAALDTVPEEGPAIERIRAALRAHLRVVAEQLDVATVFVREWRYLEGERRETFVAERRRYEERFRTLFRDGRELGELRTDLDDGTAALLALSAANWAYTWLRPGTDTDELADRFTWLLLEGMRGAMIDECRTVAINALVAGEAAYLFNCRYLLQPVRSWKDFTGNRYVLLTIGILAVIQVVFTYVPVMNRIFGGAPLDFAEWGLIVCFALLAFAAVEIEKSLIRRRMA